MLEPRLIDFPRKATQQNGARLDVFQDPVRVQLNTGHNRIKPHVTCDSSITRDTKETERERKGHMFRFLNWKCETKSLERWLRNFSCGELRRFS